MWLDHQQRFFLAITLLVSNLLWFFAVQFCNLCKVWIRVAGLQQPLYLIFNKFVFSLGQRIHLEGLLLALNFLVQKIQVYVAWIVVNKIVHKIVTISATDLCQFQISAFSSVCLDSSMVEFPINVPTSNQPLHKYRKRWWNDETDTNWIALIRIAYIVKLGQFQVFKIHIEVCILNCIWAV